MTKRHTAPRVPAEGPKKLALGLSLSERLDFVKLCERTALPWQIQVGLVTSIAKGEIHSLDKMIRFIEDVLAKDGKKIRSQKVIDQRATMLKIWSLPELERLTVAQWDLYIECLFLCNTFWPIEALHEISGWQEAWYRFCGLPVLRPSPR